MTVNIRERINRLSIPEPNSGCFLWLGALHWKTGYGHVMFNRRCREAHVVAYELANGPVPKGLELDHLCRIRCCVNPDHMEPVTHEENCRRGSSSMVMKAKYAAQTHCKHGHPFNEANTRYIKGYTKYTHRQCRECDRIRAAQRRAAQ